MSVTAIQVYNANSANPNLELGIYNDNGSGTAPATLLASAAYSDPGNASTIPQTIAIGPVSFDAGNMWLAIGCNTSSTIDLYLSQTNGEAVTAGFTYSDLPSPVTGFTLEAGRAQDGRPRLPNIAHSNEYFDPYRYRHLNDHTHPDDDAQPHSDQYADPYGHGYPDRHLHQ